MVLIFLSPSLYVSNFSLIRIFCPVLVDESNKLSVTKMLKMHVTSFQFS